MILLIDTSNRQKIKVGLKTEKRELHISRIQTAKAQAVLLLIDRVLKKHGLKICQINEIEVNTGPGSFTGLRVGAAVANTLSYILKIPVNDRQGKPITPIYEIDK